MIKKQKQRCFVQLSLNSRYKPYMLMKIGLTFLFYIATFSSNLFIKKHIDID